MKKDIINEVTACGKMGYYSEREANKAKNTVKRHTETAKTKIPVRSYYCKECGMFHLTSQLKAKK